MNACKKIFSLMLVLLLMISVVPTATANAAGGTLKVTGNSNLVYNVYLMYEIEAVETGSGEDTTTMYKYKVASGWENFAHEDYLEVKDGYAFWKKDSASASDGAAIAQLARTYVATNNLTTDKVVTAGSETALELPVDGYYLLVPQDSDTASGVVIVENGENKVIQEKVTEVGLPSVTKLVREDTAERLSSVNTVDIGQVFDVQIEIDCAAGANNYILHDQCDEHLQICDANGNALDGDTADQHFVLKRDGNLMTRGVHYTIEQNPGDGCTFHIIYNLANFSSPLTDSGLLTIDYKAKLIGSAESETDHINTAWLTHTDQNVPTNKSETVTQTFQVKVVKVDQDNEPLAGAGFVLKDVTGNYYKWDEAAQKVTWVSDVKDADVLKTELDEDGTVKNEVIFKVWMQKCSKLRKLPFPQAILVQAA